MRDGRVRSLPSNGNGCNDYIHQSNIYSYFWKNKERDRGHSVFFQSKLFQNMSEHAQDILKRATDGVSATCSKPFINPNFFKKSLRHTNLCTFAYFIMKVLYEYKLVNEIYKSNQNVWKLHIWIYHHTFITIKLMFSFSTQIIINIGIWWWWSKDSATGGQGRRTEQVCGCWIEISADLFASSAAISLRQAHYPLNTLRILEMVFENQGGKGGDELGDWDWHIYTNMYKIDN